MKRESHFFIAVPALVWQILFFYVPLTLILVMSVVVSGEGFYGMSFAQYGRFFDYMYLKIIVRSLSLALGNALLCLVLGYPVAYYLARIARKWKSILLFFLALPFWTSFLLQVYAWFFILEKHGIINSILLKLGIISQSLPLLNNLFAVYIVMLYCYIPFMIMPIYATLEKLDNRLLEASADLGAGVWQTFSRVTLPLSLPGVRTGFFLVFIPSFGEFVIPMLMGGGKTLYVGTLISHFFLVVRNAPLGAAFTSLSGVTLVMASVIVYLILYRFMRGPQGKKL